MWSGWFANVIVSIDLIGLFFKAKINKKKRKK